jgi:hypothetical protein
VYHLQTDEAAAAIWRNVRKNLFKTLCQRLSQAEGDRTQQGKSSS